MRLPIMLTVAVILGVVLGAGVFFKQQRVLGTMAVGSTRYSRANRRSVSIRFAGATAPWMIVQNTTLRIEPRDSTNITLILYVPEGTPHGNYTGTAHFYFRQAG